MWVVSSVRLFALPGLCANFPQTQWFHRREGSECRALMFSHYSEGNGVSNHRPSRLFAQPFIQVAIKENIKATPSLAFVRRIHRWPVDSPHKGTVTRKMFRTCSSTGLIYMGPILCQECGALMFSLLLAWNYKRNSRVGSDRRRHDIRVTSTQYTVLFID